MRNKKELSFNVGFRQASLFRKKLGVLFILTCMLINGFAFSTVEIGKHSLFMITIAATQDILSSVVGKYNKSLAEVSSNAYKYVDDILFGVKTDKAMAAGLADESGENSENETSGSGASAIITHSYVKGIKKLMQNESEKAVSGFTFSESMFRKYNNCKMNHEQSFMLLLLFLVFIMAIRQRKGRGDAIFASLNIINNVLGKIRISA